MNPESKIEQLQRLAGLRAEGDLAAAFTLINGQLKNAKWDLEFILEAVHQALLMDQTDLAVKLLSQFRALSKSNPATRPEVPLRLSLLTNESMSAETGDCNLDSAPEWCRSFVSEGIDPLYPASFKSFSMDCPEGVAHYHLDCECLSCNSRFGVSFELSFLIYREFLCPHCLARICLSSDVISEAATRQFPHEQKERFKSVAMIQQKIRMELNFDPVDANKYPLLCQYLNIDYAFFVNQLYLKHLDL